MAKIVILQGLPASGKSTRAKEIRDEGNSVRINKDLLRKMLHFDKWTGKNEDQTRHASLVLAKYFLSQNISVIIDDTNFNEGTIQSWKNLAAECDAKIQYERMDTPVDECLKRDASRFIDGTSVGAHVILGMALQYNLYPKPENGFVLCDLDGTLCDIRHRLPFVKVTDGEKKDWKAFFDAIADDGINLGVMDMVLRYEEQGHQIFFVSARPDNYRDATENWLAAAFKGYVPHRAVFMRHAGDRRPDTEVKKDMYERLFKDKYPIEAIIDDRPSVIRMWRDQGLNVIDVGSGVEF